MDTIKISELNNYVNSQNDDLLVVVDTENEETKKMTLQNFWQASIANLRDIIYPVGSIYISVSSTNPATLFGGTWEAISQGRCLVGVGQPVQNNNTNLGTLSDDELQWNFQNGETSGEYRHKLEINEMPSHNHNLTNNFPYGIPYNDTTGTSIQTGGLFYFGESYRPFTVENRGNDYPHNNMPPYLAVYIWKRTA